MFVLLTSPLAYYLCWCSAASVGPWFWSQIVQYSWNAQCQWFNYVIRLLLLDATTLEPSNYWCKRVEKYLLFFKSSAISIHSTMFQGVSAFEECSTFNHMAYSDWKWSSHYWAHSLYKVHLPIVDTSAWSHGVCNQDCLLFRGKFYIDFVHWGVTTVSVIRSREVSAIWRSQCIYIVN